MKKIYKLSLFITLQFLIVQFGYAQVPILGPIVGPPQPCSSANQASGTYSVAGTSNPTSFTWTAVSSNGTVIFGNPNAAVTSVTFNTNSAFATFTLYCTAQNSQGYSVPVHMVVKVFETPSVTFSGASNLCQGGSGGISASSTSSTLFQSSSTTIFWAPPIGLNSTTSPSVIANPPATTNYTILTSFGPCTATNYFLVTITPSPTFNAVFTPPSICSGQSSTLIVSGNATSYSVNGMPISTPGIYSPPSNASYTIGAAGNGPCPATGSVVPLLVNAIPVVNATFNPATICLGEKSILIITGTAQTYSVNGVQTSGTMSYSPGSSTSYTLAGTSTGSCQSTNTVVNLVVNACTGITPIVKNKSILSVYPNPTNGSFVLLTETDRTVILINELGQHIKTITLKANSEFMVSGLDAGIYFVIGGNENKKIVVAP